MSDLGWCAYVKWQDGAAWGEFLVECVAHWCGLSGDEEHIILKIDRALYKATGCGAWVRFDERGIVVGTIVEGSGADYSERVDLRGLDYSDEKVLHKRFSEAVRRCEGFASETFSEMECEE